MYSNKFIAATNDICTYAHHLNAPYMRKVFDNTNLKTARLTVTSSGFYELYLNGKHITKSPLAPYITNPDKLLFYDTYDLTARLNKGKNVLGFILGNGTVNCIGGFIWSHDKAPYRSAPAVAFALELTDNNGNTSVIEADETVLTHPSHITFDDLRSGVHADGNQYIPNWCLPDYDDSDWCKAIKSQTMRGIPTETVAESLVFSRVLTPVSITKGSICYHFDENADRKAGSAKEISKTTQYKPEENEEGYIYDLGENVAFVPTLKIKGKKGQRIILQFAESCDDGKISYENIDRFYPYGYAQRDIYICSGEGEEVFTPPFTYHAAQYCLVIGIDEEQATKDLLTFNVLHSNLESRGDFVCSSNTVNRLQEATRRSILSNFIYFPTDCPHREKNGWTGDAAVSCEHMTLNFATENSLKQWMRLIRLSQRADGAIPGIVPTDAWGYDYWNGPTWDQVIVEIPYRLYQYRGDLSCFIENEDMIMRYLHYLTVLRDSENIVDYGLGDYLQPGHPSDTPTCLRCVSSTVMAKYICERAEFLFNAAGKRAQAEFARILKEDFYNAIRKHFVDKNQAIILGACQTSQALGLYFNIFEDGERDAAYRQLLKMIDATDGHFDSGMLGMRIIFHVLASFGNSELAYKMITRTDAPSYGIWIEKFNLNSLAESFHTGKTYRIPSLNHHFMGDISNFFISEIAGIHINPNGDNAKFAEIRPQFIDELTFATAHYDTVSGRVNVHWERNENGFTVKVDKPDGFVCRLILPTGYMLEKNAHTFELDFSGTASVVPYAAMTKGMF